jgi:hypothetical protein
LELHKLVKREGRVLTFETYNCEAESLIHGSTYLFISWWGVQQLAIAQSSPGRWRKQEFTSQDAVQLQTKDGAVMRHKLVKGEKGPAEATVIPGGWDHENCLLCWQAISQEEGHEKAGYTDGRDWLCETCYAKYIASGFGGKIEGVVLTGHGKRGLSLFLIIQNAHNPIYHHISRGQPHPLKARLR